MSDTGSTGNCPDDDNAQPVQGLGIRNIAIKSEEAGHSRSIPISHHQAYLVGRDQVISAALDSSSAMPGNKIVEILGDLLVTLFGQRNISSAAASNPQQGTAGTQVRPIALRVNSNRPPPPTPPEPIMDAQLSMPTLPFLHQNSIPALIEKYREDRAKDPDAFDRRTQAIRQNLVRAKVERGGSSNLLRHEYTVELASRLDAEAADRWGKPRQHEQQEYVESEDGDSEHDKAADRESTVTYGTSPPQGLKRYITANASAMHDDGEKTPTAFLPLNAPQIPTAQIGLDEEKLLLLKDLNISDDTNHTTKSGNIRYQNKYIRETSANGSKLILKTHIEIAQVIDTVADDKCKSKGRATDEQVPPVQGSDLATTLAAMRTASEPFQLKIPVDRLASTDTAAKHAIADTLRTLAAADGVEDAFEKHLVQIVEQLEKNDDVVE